MFGLLAQQASQPLLELEKGHTSKTLTTQIRLPTDLHSYRYADHEMAAGALREAKLGLLLSPLHLKQIPSDLFLKLTGLSLPKRKKQSTKEEGWKNYHPTLQKTRLDKMKEGRTGWREWLIFMPL